MAEPKKKRGGNNNPTGKGGFKKAAPDPRRNTNGQRKAAAVRTAAEYRDYLIEILGREVAAPLPDKPTYLQKIAYEHVMRAAKGDDAEREKLLDRIWGKSTQPIKHEFDELSDDELIRRAAQLTAGIAATIGSVAATDE